MTLAPAQNAILEAPFRASEHRFDASNNLYLEKEAIRRRLSLVDPHWMQSEPHLVGETADLVSLSSTITVCGATRSAVGAAIINRWKNIEETVDGKKLKRRVELDGYDLARKKMHAYKYADSDLLPRIAMQFGVGAYLKSPAAKGVKTEEQLKEFLAKLPPPPDVHWAFNGGGQRVTAFLDKLQVKWDDIKDVIEPNKVLVRLSETILTEAEFMVRMVQILTTPAAPKQPAEEATTASH